MRLEEDLVEEIARHVGYDKIASELPPSNMAGEYQPAEMKRRALRRALTSLGFDEAINFSFIEPPTTSSLNCFPRSEAPRQRAAELWSRSTIRFSKTRRACVRRCCRGYWSRFGTT